MNRRRMFRMRTLEVQDLELEISLLIDLVVAEGLVKRSPYAHESPKHNERVKRVSKVYGLLSTLTRQRIVVGLERHRAR